MVIGAIAMWRLVLLVMLVAAIVIEGPATFLCCHGLRVCLDLEGVVCDDWYSRDRRHVQSR
jgi:hypothetical protein